MKGICVLFALVFLSIPAVQAQQGPVVPCVGCDSLTRAPYPETGLWHNPEQSPGSGLNFEIQNGVLAGFFYGYTAEGKPEWQLVSGELVPSEIEGVLWELETTLSRADGGSCTDCEFTPPQIAAGETIRLEFMQRNYLRIRIGSGFDQYFVPFTYGSSARAYFGNKTPYKFPEFTGITPFVATMKPGDKMDDPGSWWVFHFNLELVGVVQVNNKRTLRYAMENYISPDSPATADPPPPVHLAYIDCQLDSLADAPFCLITFAGYVGSMQFLMPAGNFGDSRFFAESVTAPESGYPGPGSTIQGYRLDYD